MGNAELSTSSVLELQNSESGSRLSQVQPQCRGRLHLADRVLAFADFSYRAAWKACSSLAIALQSVLEVLGPGHDPQATRQNKLDTGRSQNSRFAQALCTWVTRKEHGSIRCVVLNNLVMEVLSSHSASHVLVRSVPRSRSRRTFLLYDMQIPQIHVLIGLQHQQHVSEIWVEY